jgi:hypothetical protein
MTDALRGLRGPVIAIAVIGMLMFVGAYVAGALGSFVPIVPPTRPAACSYVADNGICYDRLYIAWQWLDSRMPGHPEVVAIDDHEDRSGCTSDVLCVRSGGLPVIYDFRFADGTAVSIVVDCPGVGPCEVVRPG